MYNILIQSAIYVSMLLVIILGFVLLAIGIVTIPCITRTIGEELSHGDAGFAAGILVDIWIVAFISFIIIA